MNSKELVNNPDYEQIAVLDHQDMKPFLLKEMADNQGWAKVSNMYQLLGWFTLVLGIFKAFMPFYARREYIYLIYLLAGVCFLFTVGVLLHELVHALAYRYVGARHLSFGMNLKKFMFYVQADGEVLDYRQFKIVALAPAVVIGVLSLLGMAVFYNQPLFYFFLAILGLHSMCCAGDFGLLCFFQNREPEEIFTFDCKQEGKTCFYKRRREKQGC